MPTEAPSISLCIITRDQDSLLKRCLEHHRPLYKEAVVVDTAPECRSDNLDLGPQVKVFNYPWQDDFSAARNFSLSKAKEQYILILDCDEMIAEESFSDLLLLATDQRPQCFAFPQRNYLPASRGAGWEVTGPEHKNFSLGAPGFQTAWSVRLFPNHQEMEYRGTVHESLEESIRERQLPSCHVDIPVHHQGHMLNYPRPEGRTGFYGNLLVKKVKQEPGNPMARYELAVHLVAVGKRELAEKWLSKTLAEFPYWPGTYRARLLLGEIQIQQGKLHQGASLCKMALEDRPDWPACWEGVINASLAKADRKEAERYLGQARVLFPQCQAWERYEAQVSTMDGR